MPQPVDSVRGARTSRLRFGRRKDHGRNAVIAASIRFAKDARGATAIEYGLICGLIFLVIATALNTFAVRMEAMYAFLGTKVGQTP